MLTKPKGYEYWETDENGKNIISDDAPEWAKKEFEEYIRKFDASIKPDDGVLIDY